MNFLSVCSGIEAASVAWNPLGWRAVAFSEIEKFPSAVLKYHYPDVPNLGDFTKIDTSKLGDVDILCGGTPCQAFSIAGLRRGLDDDRGNLTLEFVRLAHELADRNRLRNAVWENVPGVLSDAGNAFGCFLGGLVGADGPIVPGDEPADGKSNQYWRWDRKEQRHIPSWSSYGMVAGPKGRAAWCVKDAQFYGLAQRRRRVIVVADFGNGADPAAVLFEPESVCRDTAPRREAGQNVAPTISERPTGGGGLGTDFDLDGGLNSAEIAPTLNAAFGSKLGLENQHIDGGAGMFVAHSLRSEGFDASKDGTGRGTPIAPVSVALRGRDDGATGEMGDDVSFALRASQGGGDKPYVLAPVVYSIQAGCVRENSTSGPDGLGVQEDISYTIEARAEVQAVAFDCKASGRSGFGVGDVAPTLRAMGHKDSHNNGGGQVAVQQGWAVRRLTPTECERLQGFPDGYTNIPWRGKPDSPDGLRYKSLGNSWAVPLFRWLGKRIERHMP